MRSGVLFHRRRFIRLVVTSLLLILTLMVTMLPLMGPADVPASAMGLGHFPLSFVPNFGQFSSPVQFQVQSAKNTIFFTPSDIVLLLRHAGGLPALVSLHYMGSNPACTMEGAELLPGTANYLRGEDPADWFINLPTFGAVMYKDLYPGVDLRYEGLLGELKGTFILAPGIDPTVIRWRHLGLAEVTIDEATGDLIITVQGFGDSTLTLVEGPPIVSQSIDGEEVPVEADYVIHEDGSVGFELGEYDSEYPLVIDPTLTYSTYLGGSSLEDVGGIATDADGSMYVVGSTTSHDFPTVLPIDDVLTGYDDVYVTKLSAAGDALIYSTYIGGGEDDEGLAIDVDAAGYAYITGLTSSNDYPTAGAAQATFGGLEDGFVTKLSPAGDNLVYSTFLGGSHLDQGAGIAVDSSGSAYVVGMTFSTNFPVEGALQPTYGGGNIAQGGDAFVTKLNADGDAWVYSTYLGGNATDFGAAIAVDATGNAYAVGETWSTNFPTQNPLQAAHAGESDLFVAKLNVAGDALVYGTYIGGTDSEYAYSVAVDGSGSAYVNGNTLSTDYPTMNPLQAALAGDSDAFVTKLNPAGSALTYSTYLGGSAFDKSSGIAVTGTGEAYVTGDTMSADFPVASPIQNYAGGSDAFLVKLGADGSGLEYGTYMGGSEGDYGVDVATDDAGMAYLAGVTFSTDFPTVDPVYDTYSGSGDVFLAKISDEAGPTPPPAPNFFGSTKVASDTVVAAGDTLIYTVSLYNSGEVSGVASVDDPLPEGLDYVPGSADATAGTYNAGNRTVSWSDITVAAGATEELTFAATPISVTHPTVITNTAIFETDGDTFERYAGVLVLSTEGDKTEPDLRLSHKLASKPTVSAAETFTFTVRLINSGYVSTTVTVTDPLSEDLDYVPGSADDTGGTYDAGTRTVSWVDVTVAARDSEALTFAVTAPDVATPTPITNTATIEYDTETLKRSAAVLVSPSPITWPEYEFPIVHEVVIDDQDVLTDPTVTLHISATDNVAVEWMHIREWYLDTEPVPHWEVVHTTEWVPYEAETSWTLHPTSGVHFVGVWVADAEYHVSLLNEQNLDYASLLLPDETIPTGGYVPYLVHYEGGESANAVLEPSEGDADLYVWFPGSFGLPDELSVNPDSATDSVSFTAPEDGAYIFLVHGYTASTFDLTITPAGTAEPFLASQAGESTSLTTKRALLFEPVFSQSGMDPLTTPTQWQPRNFVFLPLVTH